MGGRERLDARDTRKVEEHAQLCPAPQPVQHEGALYRAALEAALEAVGLPAFLLDAAGQVQHANSAGRTWLTPARAHTLREALLARQRTPEEAGWLELTPVQAPGLPPHHLALVRGPTGGLEERLERATHAWGLTPRQREVLHLLVQGRTNKAISGRLGTSERTVELHVTTLLRKVAVDGRSALAARFWTLPL